MAEAANQLLLKRLSRKTNSNNDAGLTGIFEIAMTNSPPFVSLNFYYTSNNVVIYLFQNVSVSTGQTVYLPYTLPSNFVTITFTLQFSSIPDETNVISATTNGIINSAGSGTEFFTFDIKRNAHNYLQIEALFY
jgi:hypothetical protein